MSRQAVLKPAHVHGYAHERGAGRLLLHADGEPLELGPKIDGRYKSGDDVVGGFWHAIGLCRFEPGELDEHIPGLRLPDDAILVPR